MIDKQGTAVVAELSTPYTSILLDFTVILYRISPRPHELETWTHNM